MVIYPGRTCPGDNREMLRVKWMEDAGKRKKVSVGTSQTGFHLVLKITLSGGHQYLHFIDGKTEA